MKTLAITITMILIVPLLVIIPITVNSNNANAAESSNTRDVKYGPPMPLSSEPIRGPVLGTASR